MFTKLFHLHVCLFRKIFFFLPKALRGCLAKILAVLLYFVEIYFVVATIILVSLYLYLGTGHATKTITNFLQNTLSATSEDPDGFKMELGKLSLENGILIENFSVADSKGVWLEFGSIHIDIELPELVYAFTKLTIDNVTVNDANYYRIPYSPPKPRTPHGVQGMMIPEGVLPYPLGEIEILNLSLNNAHVAPAGMNLEGFPIDLYVDVQVHALLQRDLATFNVSLQENEIQIDGLIEYRTHEFFVDVEIEDTKWARVFPKVEKINADIEAYVRGSEFPPSPERPLTVDLKGITDIKGVFWANKKDILADIDIHFSFDRTYTAATNTRVTSEDFDIFVPYFAVDTWKGEYAQSIAKVKMHNLNAIVPALYGSIEGDVHFNGPFRKFYLNFDMTSPKFYFGADDFELFTFYDNIAQANTTVDILELNTDIKWAGFALADALVKTKDFAILGEKTGTYLEAHSEVTLDRYDISFNETQIDVEDAIAYTPKMKLAYDSWVSGTFPKFEGAMEINANSLKFMGDNFPIHAEGSALLKLEGVKNQKIHIDADVKNFLMPGLAIDEVKLDAVATNTDLIMDIKFPVVDGTLETSYPDLYDIQLNTVENKAYESTKTDFHFENNVFDFTMLTEGQLTSKAEVKYSPLLSEVTIKSFTARYIGVYNALELSNSVTINFADYLNVSPFELTMQSGSEIGTIKGEAVFKKDNFMLSSQVYMPFHMLKPYVDFDTGTLELDVFFEGAYDNPNGQMQLNIRNFLYMREVYGLAFTGKIIDSGLEWTGQFGERSEPVVGQGVLPIHFTPYPNLDKKGRVRAQARWEGNIDFLWRLFPSSTQEFSGEGMFNLNVLGTYDKPLITGKAFLAKARYADTLLNFVVSDIDAEINLRDTNAEIKLRARDGSVETENNKDRGVLLLNGSLFRKGDTFEVDLKSAFNSFAPLRRDDIRFMKSGVINITGEVAKPLISGNVHVNEAVFLFTQDITKRSNYRSLNNVTFVSNIVDELEEESIDVPFSIQPEFNIQIKIPPVFKVKGIGLDSIWQGDLVLLGNLDEPLLVGTLSHSEGTFELVGKEFELTRSAVIFSGNIALPIYNVVVERSNEVIDTIATVTGTGTNVDVTITSEPVLPINEILARTIYAKSLAELSQFEALQVAATASQLLSPTLAQFNILEATRKNLGLDVRINTNDSVNSNSSSNSFFDNVAVEVGGYLSDSLYVGVEQGMEDTALHLEVKLFSNINADARIGTDTSRAGILWKNDY